ncbi:MAG: mannose-1-phosphate guanylyltransferase/mannose-6-phosphate isomerase [Pseudomonadota bacterium]
MKASLVTPVVLAGGKGTRLWPLSRTALPKQFCKLNEAQSLFQQTVDRLCRDPMFTDPIILTSASHLDLVSLQLKEIKQQAKQIICEPEGRDTAPAVALSAIAGKIKGQELLLVLPSDHKILDNKGFLDAARKAAGISLELNKIVTFGVKPSEAATEYGYLEAGEKIADGLGNTLTRFIEKPNKKKAEALLSQSNIYWNAGIFMFPPKLMCRELETHMPVMFKAVNRSLAACDLNRKVITPDPQVFTAIDPISIDYAVMEKTDCAALVPVDPQWSDLGSWSAVWTISEKDEDGNVLVGDTLVAETQGSLVSSDGPFVGVSGVSDLIVVANRDAVLVTSRENCQSVKTLISEMSENYTELTKSHVSETRPWGTFTSVNRGESHQVKSIVVNPGGQLSLQYHFHRAEHWIVVSGTATVTVDDEVSQLTPCQQIFIPQGAVHRLENLTDEPVQLIEVQYGSYLGEDDIVRLSDVYDRASLQEEPELKEAV